MLSTKAEDVGSEICRILHNYPAIAEFNNKLLYYSFKIINSNFKNKLKMLTSVDVKFTSKVHLFREI